MLGKLVIQMNFGKIVGALFLIASLWVLWSNIKPYFDLLSFWGRLGPAGLFIMNAFWLFNFLPMTILGVVLLIISIYLIRRKTR